jgi:hypothetical protein
VRVSSVRQSSIEANVERPLTTQRGHAEQALTVGQVASGGKLAAPDALVTAL